MTDIHYIIRNLKSRTDVTENLREYVQYICDRSRRQSLVNLAYQYMALYETLIENGGISSVEDRAEGSLLEVLEVINDAAAHLDNLDASDVSRLTAIREKNISAVSNLSSMVDLFNTDEYVLNRVEHLFIGDNSLPAGYSDMEMTSKLIAFLAGFREEAQNLYIVRMISELPVRMTKNRFYDVLSSALGIYRDSDRSAFEGMMQAVRSAAGIGTDLSSDPMYEGLRMLNENIKHVKESVISEEEYKAFNEALKLQSDIISENMDLGRCLQDLLNSLIAYCLSGGQGTVDDSAVQIIKEISVLVENKKDCEVPESVLKACEALEGKQEALLLEIQEAEAMLPQIEAIASNIYEEFTDSFSVLHCLSILRSQSPFASLSASEETTEEKVSDELLKKETECVLKELSGVFSESSKLYSRAVMARIFSVLPPRFMSQEELENYIFEALSGCSSEAEKLGCIDVLNQIMEE